MSEVYSPPKRSQTQSPGMVNRVALQQFPQFDRPTSAMDPTSFQSSASGQSRAPYALPSRRRQFSTDLRYAAPQDNRAEDPLERWRGHPIFHWSPSGALVSSFPKQAPFYAAGHGIPTIKCTPGDITIHDTKATLGLGDRDAKFPGPLSGKGKSKKKDLLTWLSGKTEDLERAHEATQLDLGLPPLIKRRAEEKVVLWKLVKMMVETDNGLDKTGQEETLRKILIPSMLDKGPFSPSTDGPSTIQAEAVPAETMFEIRRYLLEGQREKAVWFAAEKRLWAHAMLVASTLGPEVWKQLTSEFVKSQVKDSGENMQSLAALFQVFAGSAEESVDNLVPPSARAGFQMVSKRQSMGPGARNPLEGLDQWRETLALIVSNRSNNDGPAIAALGRLLASYGRVEAAHSCFLFARPFVVHSGADDEKANFVLLGADHTSQTMGLGSDLDAILLTEVYEYALTLTPSPGASPIIPHLQPFKLIHAYELAEHGQRSEAQGYCDAIATAIKASTRASPYYHVAFASMVEDLNRCLSQAPQTGSSSGWVSKLSSDKVSGSMWKRFNNFVAGEDGEAATTASGPDGADSASPFARLAGDSPTVSRAASSTDLYGAMHGGYGGPATGQAASPYAPGFQQSQPQHQLPAGRYAPQAASTYAPSRTSLDSTRSQEAERPGSGYTRQYAVQRATTTPYGAYMPQAQNKPAIQSPQSLYAPRPEASRAASDYNVPYLSLIHI